MKHKVFKSSGIFLQASIYIKINMGLGDFLIQYGSPIVLLCAGAFFIIEGALLIDFYKKNPTNINPKLYTAGGLTIGLGAASILFAAYLIVM